MWSRLRIDVRRRPPTRRSTSANVFSQRLSPACHQRRITAGFVQASKSVSAGASYVRSTRSSLIYALYPMRYSHATVDAGVTLQRVRARAGLSQAELARRAGTSQATVSAYESGSKQPTVATFSRLLASAGVRLTVEAGRGKPVAEPAPGDLKRAGETLAQVIRLA